MNYKYYIYNIINNMDIINNKENDKIYDLAKTYYNSNKKRKSKELFTKLVNLGDERGKFYCYLNGWNKPIDLRKAAHYNNIIN